MNELYFFSMKRGYYFAPEDHLTISPKIIPDLRKNEVGEVLCACTNCLLDDFNLLDFYCLSLLDTMEWEMVPTKINPFHFAL